MWELILGSRAVFSGNLVDPGLFAYARAALNPSSFVWSLMILVAIFSVIVLLLCFLCYSGDCNN